MGPGHHLREAVSAAAPGKENSPMAHDHHTPSLTRNAVQATLHCLTGCAIGEVLGMVLATALGWGGVASIAVSVALADRKSTRLNSSHPSISYAVFCLKKKKPKQIQTAERTNR